MATIDSAQPRYPGPSDFTETHRLRAQHNICTYALTKSNNPILAPLDLSQANLAILDSGTADGYFLYAIIPFLEHADSAELIGTDITDYPPSYEVPERVSLKLMKQNIHDPWPAEWKNKFDLVHQRAVMANAGGYEKAVDITRRLFELVKPGGYRQIVDGFMPVGKIVDGDLPSQRMFKKMGNFIASKGLDTSMGPRLGEMVNDAGGSSIEDVSAREGTSRLGRGCAQATEEDGWIQIRSLCGILKSIEQGLDQDTEIAAKHWIALEQDVFKEAEQHGFDMFWYAAWVRKKV